jgi:F420-dependent oxidoreductase-like protein
MRFSFWPGSANPWDDILSLAKHAEATGWDGIWFADHFMPNTPEAKGPTNECFTVMAGLAAAVPRVRVGSLVAGNMYRHPAAVAKMAAGIDNISGGRFVLGLGSGWQENEHQKYGMEFSTVPGRLKRLEEACEVVTRLLRDDRTTFEGKFYQLEDAPLDPKPVQQPLPLLIGGGGEKVTMRIAAKYANEWNVWGTPEVMRQKMAILDEHCRKAGRDPKEIKRSCQTMLFLSDDPAVIERAKPMASRAIAGNLNHVKSVMKEYVDAGVDEFILPDFTLGTGERRIETMNTFIEKVAPEFR